MTTEQKLKLFVQTAIQNVNNQKSKQLKDYETQIATDFAQQREAYRVRSAAALDRQIEHARLEKNHKVSEESTRLKKELAQMTAASTDTIFDEVRKELTQYKATTKYAAYLQKLIECAKKLADGSPCKIYLDAGDEALLPLLEKKCDITIHLSKHHLFGGIMARIPEKNLLFDESFASKLTQAKEHFIL